MNPPLSFFLLPLLASLAAPALAQDVGRVFPASLPLPLPTAAPLPPDQLRARNPWNLSMTGTWRFALTRGHMAAGQFQSSQAGTNGLTASSNEEKNPPENAFDGSPDTRWCASSNSYPQWLQADLRKTQRVSGITLIWERPGETYQFRVEGGTDGKHWKTLADRSAAPGQGDGPVALTTADVRYVRITALGSSGTSWASLREFGIRLTQDGQETAWQPPAPKPPDNSAAARDAFAAPGFDDSVWDDQPIPSNWEMQGYSEPTYGSVDNTVGLYRRSVTVPAAWAGRRIFWHFDGALDGAEVFVNGRKAGYHESGYTAWDIDLTGLVKPGQKNLFAARVSKTTPSSECETGDFQCMGGIYRDTSLIAVPQTHVSDITIRTPLSANDKDATLSANVQVKGTPGETVAVTGKLVGAKGDATTVQVSGQGRIGPGGTAAIALSAPVRAPKLWSAEKPNLYYLIVQVSSGGKPVERVEQRFGFRQIEVKNNIVLWNGMPIKCTGTCRHDFWADKGFALTEAQWAKDLTMMKAANINAIRTSHYNHAQRFLELCEEKGMYILDEVPYCWIGDLVKDPAFAPFLIQRATETLARDKNRPCVLAWSIGNENPYGPDSQQVIDFVKRADPTHPAFVSCTSPNDTKKQDWEDDHYPDPNSVDRIAASLKWGANFSEHPHIFYQEETQNYDPGASDLWSETLIKTWDKLWKAPTILGSFIWEWQNQGIADKIWKEQRAAGFPSRTTHDDWFSPDHLHQENNKGIVDAYRNLKPEWWVVKMAYSPVVVGTRMVSPAGGTCAVPLTNHYSFTDLKELACRWTALKGDQALQAGVQHIACAPMQSVQASFPAPAGMTLLRLEFDRAEGTSVVAANLPVEGAPRPAPPAALAEGGALTTTDGADTLKVASDLQEIVFDKHSGTIQSWRVHGKDMLLSGPILNLGEAKESGEKGVYRAKQPPVTDSAQVTALPSGDGRVHVAVTSAILTAAGGSPLGTLSCSYLVQPDAEVTVNWTLDWTAPKTNLWEDGLKFSVPAGMTQMTWQRDSYFLDYPKGHLGEPSGTATAGERSFAASKRGLHWLTLTDRAGTGLALLPAANTEVPLVGRADADATGTTLFASREVAGPWDFSGSWVNEHDIHADKGQPLSGEFTLRAIAP